MVLLLVFKAGCPTRAKLVQRVPQKVGDGDTAMRALPGHQIAIYAPCSLTGMRREPKGLAKAPKRPAMPVPQCRQ